MKSGFVSIVGKPNVGKSTLLNKIIGEKIAITSRKPQTTRVNIIGILQGEDAQIVFIDTPGMHEGKNKLDARMKGEIRQAREDGDIQVLVVSSQLLGEEIYGDVLVINKVDIMPKEEILKIIEENKDKFDEIFCVSAKTGEGISELVDYIKGKMPEGERFFGEDEITTQPERVLMAEYIREQAFRLLGDEVPFGVAVVVEKMKLNAKGILDIEANIYCERESHKGIIIGKKGIKLKEIASKAREQGERFFGKKIFLQVWVKVAANWRDDERMINKLTTNSE